MRPVKPFIKMKQSTWEAWFIVSIIASSSLFFVGTIEGSRDMFPNFLWAFIPSIINLAVCLYYGLKHNDE
jgi:hypothetical protein